MKFFDIDWNKIFECLPVWDAMEPESRRQFLDLKLSHSQGAPARLYGKDAAVMVKLGLVAPDVKDRLRPTPETGVLFRRIFMQFLKQPVFEETAGSNQLSAYLGKHLMSHDVTRLEVHWEDPRISLKSEAWPRTFYESADPQAWETPRRGWSESAGKSIYGWRTSESLEYATYLTTPELAKGVQALVRMAYESPAPLPLNLLRDGPIPGLAREDHAAAFLAAVRYALIFPGLLPDSLESVFWIWPPTAHRLHRKQETAPDAVEAREIYCPPFLLEDCMIVLARALTGPLATKKFDFKNLYEKVRNEIVPRFSPLPAPVDEMKPDRLAEAIGLLLATRMLKVVELPKQCIEATPAAMEWMQAPATERLQSLLDIYRIDSGASSQVVAGFRGSRRNYLPWVFYKRASRNVLKPFLPVDWVNEVWSSAADDTFYFLEEWMRFHADRYTETGLTPDEEISIYPYHYQLDPAEEVASELLKKMLTDFFYKRLVPLGCVRLGEAPDGTTCFALTSTGRFFLTGNGEVDASTSPAGEILINPDFEIVFLGFNAIAEAELSLLAEKCGAAPGVVLRITKSSILKAIQMGNPAEQLLATLERISSKPVPANVQAQIRGWAATCRQVEVRNVTLLTCPDALVATQLLSLLGPKCELLTPQLISMPQGMVDPKIRQRLEKEGIFFTP